MRVEVKVFWSADQVQVLEGHPFVNGPPYPVFIGLLNVIENEESDGLTPEARSGGFVDTTTGLVWEEAGGTAMVKNKITMEINAEVPRRFDIVPSSNLNDGVTAASAEGQPAFLTGFLPGRRIQPSLKLRLASRSLGEGWSVPPRYKIP
jgi:hypothetical protein